MESKKTHLISMNLPVLQNALKRDPESYKEEVLYYAIIITRVTDCVVKI